MLTELRNTDVREITAALLAGQKHGIATSGLVLTLVINTTIEQFDEVRPHAIVAGQQHPSRILLIVHDPDALHIGDLDEDVDPTGIDAEVIAGDELPGEMVTLWLSGDAEKHAASMVRPLLLPELPIVAWWPGAPPTDLEHNDLAALFTRRIFNTAAADDEIKALHRLAAQHAPGQTDLNWARLTRWRALLVALLDNVQVPVQSVTLQAPLTSSAAELLATWIEMKLEVEVSWEDFEGPGLGAVIFHTEDGDISLARTSASHGLVTVPGRPDATVALARRNMAQLIGEELVRLHGDEMFDAIMARVASRS